MPPHPTTGPNTHRAGPGRPGPMTVVRFVLLVVHVLVGAVWLGAMVYSLAAVQRRVRQFFGDAVRAEEVAVFLAAGARAGRSSG